MAKRYNEAEQRAYEDGYNEAMALSVRLFHEYLASKMEVGVMYLDMQHLNVDKKWFTLWMQKHGRSTDKQHRIKDK